MSVAVIPTQNKLPDPPLTPMMEANAEPESDKTPLLQLFMYNKCLIFILTSWSYGALEGTASAFSMTKEPMSQDLSLSEPYLGLVDSVTIIGTILGTFLMISLTRNIRRNFLIFTIIHSIFFCMLTFSEHIPGGVGKVVILVCMFIVGISKASIVFPQIMFSHFFDSGEEKFLFNLWYGLTFLGDTLGILLSKLIISELKLGWDINIYFFSAVLLLSTTMIYFLIGDPPNHEEEEQPETVCEILGNIKQFLKPTTNKLITADFALEEVLYNNIILWMPFSFEINGLEGQDYIATLSFPIAIALGALVVEYPLSYCEAYSKYLLTAMILVCCGTFFVMMRTELTQENVTLHIILLGVSGFIMGAPYSRVCSGDPAEVCENDTKKIHTAFFTINFVRYLSSAVVFFLIGLLLKQDKSALQKINFYNILLVLIISVTRRFFFPPQLGQAATVLKEEEELPQS